MIVQSMLQLRQRAARRLGDLTLGSLTSIAAAGTTLVDTKRVEADSHWVNGYIRIGEDASGEELRITASTLSATSLTVAPATAGHASGTSYELTMKFAPSDYQDMVEQAILDAATEAVLSNLEYTSLTGVLNQWEYVIPNNFRYIDEVWIQDTQGFYTERIHNSVLRVISGSIPKLAFPTFYPIRVGATIRILGQGEQTIPANADTGSVQLDPAYIITHCLRQAHGILAIREEGDEAAKHAREIRILAAELESMRGAMSLQHRANPGVLVVP